MSESSYEKISVTEKRGNLRRELNTARQEKWTWNENIQQNILPKKLHPKYCKNLSLLYINYIHRIVINYIIYTPRIKDTAVFICVYTFI